MDENTFCNYMRQSHERWLKALQYATLRSVDKQFSTFDEYFEYIEYLVLRYLRLSRLGDEE